MLVSSEAKEYSTISLLIENTPFTEVELQQLVGLFEALGPSHLLVDHTPNGVVPKDDSTLRMLTAMTSNAQHDVRKMHTARSIERTFPQAFLRTLEKALFHSEETCYVMHCGVSDVELFKFVEAMAVLMGRRGSNQVIEFLYDSVSDIDSNGGATATELVRLCYTLAVVSSVLSCYCDDTMGQQLDTIQRYSPPQSLVASLALLAGKQNANGTKVGDTFITRPLFREWIHNTAPHLASTLPTFLHHLVFMGKPFPKSRLVPFRFPDLGDQTSICFSSADPYSPLQFCFASLSHSLSTKVRTEFFPFLVFHHPVYLLKPSDYYKTTNNRAPVPPSC
jgi:hypothetical protein